MIEKLQPNRVRRTYLEVVAPRYRAAAMGVYLCGAFIIGCPATAVLGYVGQHFSYQHGIAIFGGTYAVGAVAVLIARLCFFRRDRVDPGQLSVSGASN